MSFAKALKEWGPMIEARLLDAVSGQPPSAVRDAMAHALQGGKRMRGILVIEGAALHDIPAAQAVHAAAAIESMHACSLVHDDLPAMDDDDLRRGRPTVHVKWDEATAVLAGDALQTLAFEILARPDCAPEAERRIDLVAAMADAAGAAGMVLGQALDLAAERAVTPLTLGEITRLQAGKTGALIGWAGTAGARLAGADTAPLARYSAALGLAFQIADDILDVEGDPDKAGKRLRKDAEAGKATFVSLLGMEGARGRAADLIDEADVALEVYGRRAESLRALARFAISREN